MSNNNVPQEVSDEERYVLFQQELLAKTMEVVEEHAVGMPMRVMRIHMKQMKGDLWVQAKNQVAPQNQKPFRLKVRVKGLMGEERISEVIGWG